MSRAAVLDRRPQVMSMVIGRTSWTCSEIIQSFGRKTSFQAANAA